jgi:diguanylate cyclase (GGDEF)-like protein/PAS domain S-box-containing protein
VLTSLIAIVAVCVFRVVSVMRSQQAVILEDHRLAEVREAWIHSVLENTAEAVVTIDVDGTIRSVNRAAREMFGRDAIALAGKPISMLITSEGQHEFGAYLVARMRHVDDGLGSGARETIGIRANLERFPIEYSAGETEQDGRKVFIVTIRDITDQKARNDALEHDAMHDRLTGLPNRALLQDRVTQALALARRNKHGMAVLMLDFNHFKEVNDQLGHEVGDGLLRELSDRMTGALRTVDTIARLGGDEFVILPADVRDAEGAERIADKVISAMSKPFVIQGNSIATGVSIGIAIYPEHGLDGDSLLRHADHVMYIAKRAGVGYSPKPPQKVNVPA